MRSILILEGLSVFFLAANVPARADDAQPIGGDLEYWRRVYLSEARQWTMKVEPRERAPVLDEQPVMFWASDNDYNGAVYVWRADGRPEIVGSVFSAGIGSSTNQRYVFHELQSVSVRAVNCRHPVVGGTLFPAVLKPKLLEKAPAPAASQRAQMLQAKQLSRQFSAQMTYGDEEWDLRLLPQPIDEFKVHTDSPIEVRTGAIFAMVAFVTDPEVLLLLEVRETDDGPRWHYQPLRFTNRSIEVEWNGEVVWVSRVRGSTPTGENEDDRLYKYFGRRRMTKQ